MDVGLVIGEQKWPGLVVDGGESGQFGGKKWLIWIDLVG